MLMMAEHLQNDVMCHDVLKVSETTNLNDGAESLRTIILDASQVLEESLTTESDGVLKLDVFQQSLMVHSLYLSQKTLSMRLK